jgi:phosphoenolpyruvate carboxykinase (ATP)
MADDKRMAHLTELGLRNLHDIYWNLHRSQLYEIAIKHNEGSVAQWGPLVVRTGIHTGRSPKDRFVVKEPSTENEIWWGNTNRPFKPETFDQIQAKVTAYLQNADIFVQDCWCGADEKYRLPVRILTEDAWHNMFARNMFRQATEEELENFEPEYTVINVPSFRSDPEVDETNSQTFVLVNMAKKLILIGGTSYAGEIKKSVFSIMNYLLPKQGVLSMHCSANTDLNGENPAVFFGLSGTGKTTLSSDSNRLLIGDDEHGWADDGIFNFEGGCYAKVIKLSPEGEPEIYATTRKYGTILENVVMNPQTRDLDLDDDSYTQNTRASYPLTSIPNILPEARAGHPNNVIFLTADAFGVLPPVSKLTPAQAMYHFLNGYTAKVAGTEKGVTEPQATFSACFGEPFMPLHPADYAELLAEKVRKHGANVWLVNTGWTGGPHGVGSRMKLSHTRAMITAILDGTLAEVETQQEPFFGLHIPVSCPGVPDEVLTPRATWADKAAYDAKAKDLAARFAENFKKYADRVTDEVKEAAGQVQA